MARILSRFYRAQQRQEDLAKIVRIVNEAPDVETPVAKMVGGRSAEGDPRRLRGLPAIARGVSGAIPGTDPGRG